MTKSSYLGGVSRGSLGISLAGATSWTTGRSGDALRFNGTSGYASTVGAPIRTDWSFTVSAWVRLDATVPSGSCLTAVSQDGNRRSGFQLAWCGSEGGRWVLTLPSADADASVDHTAGASAPTPAGTWTHLLGTFNSANGDLRLYVDGVQRGAGTHYTSRWNAAGGLQIGHVERAGAYTWPWNGAIDEVQVYQRVLTESEIDTLAGRPANEEAFYPLDDTGAEAADASGNYRNATLGTGASWTGEGRVGGALRLDGTSAGYVATSGPVVRTDGSFTVSAWAKPEWLTGGSRTVVSQDGAQASGFALHYRWDLARWAFSVAYNSAGSAWISAVDPSPPTLGEWVHLVGVQDIAKQELRLYVDGNLAGRTSFTTTRWNASGPLRLGQAKWNSTAADFFRGDVDNVSVYTGVRTDDEIGEAFGNPETARTTVYTGQFSRWVNHSGDHLSGSSGSVPLGYHFEGSLGLPAPAGAANTRTLYACMAAVDEFTSGDPGCEGQRRLGPIGLVYIDPPGGVPTLPLYRCRVTTSGEHFDSGMANCEGQSPEQQLGYVRAYGYLTRYVQPYSPWDHRTSTVGVPAGYVPEGTLGSINLAGGPNSRAMYACLDNGTDGFTSLDPACEGEQIVGAIGNIWTAPPPDVVESRLLYRCIVPDSGDRFDSGDPDCEGNQVERELGYVATRL